MKNCTNWFVGSEGIMKIFGKDWKEICEQENNRLGGDYKEQFLFFKKWNTITLSFQ